MMRRAASCTCHPHIALAGQKGNWTFTYTLSEPLAKGSRLAFDLDSFGTPGEWQIPAANEVILSLPSKKDLAAKKDGNLFVFILPVDLKTGQNVTITLHETRAQLYLQRRRPFLLHITPKGQESFSEHFLIDVRGNTLHHLQVICPAIVQKNKRFDIVVRFEDAFGNLTHHAPEETLIEISYEHLRENLNWKLFVPETGFVCLPNLYFNETGLFRIQLKNLHTQETFFSSPILCTQEIHRQLFWGVLQGDCDKIHPKRGWDTFLRYFRDEQTMCFFSPFLPKVDEEEWKALQHFTAEINENERFSPFIGSFWHGANKTEGARHLLFAKDQKPFIDPKETKYNSLKKVYKTFSPKELLSIPTLTTIEGYGFDFKEHSSEFERVVEIYNGWEDSEKHLQKALLAGLRFGFVAGGFGDQGSSQLFLKEKRKATSPGLTAILSKEHSREGIFEALTQRLCYATTGEAILLDLSLIGQPMGSVLSTQQKPGLYFNRHFSGFVAGTTPLKTVELIRNGQVVHSFEIGKNQLSIVFEFDDPTPLDQIVKESDLSLPFVFYYLRVQQNDGHRAWSSPLWVELHGNHNNSTGKKAKKR